ncbi:ubiquitin carboxyl-terminal hydrolase 1 [Brachionichthys hirsutus]|uniref:ubiquitin carboxyl-terminal hydrolase 1 n=1 Tax=Brachionichthys hirsutus TaxID=412623 RepID=UPI00360457D7
MPGLRGGHVGATQGSPVKKSKLSLKYLRKKEAKRALDFSEPQAEDLEPADREEREASGCDQVVPGPSRCPPSPGFLVPCEKTERAVPFVGLNNLGNTCYLNSILQVLHYCPRLRAGVKNLYSLSRRKEAGKSEELSEVASEAPPVQLELLGSLNGLIASMEQLQSSFLLNPGSFSQGELATPPRRILHTLRQLNPMYDGYLQHDAQEVLQCILGYIQEACHTIRKEQEDGNRTEPEESTAPTDHDGQVSGKRKSDAEVGNAKKKPKSGKADKSDASGDVRNAPLTRSKGRPSCSTVTGGAGDVEHGGTGEEGGSDGEATGEGVDGKRKRKSKLSWLRPSGKQPSIFSKFRSAGKISCSTARKHDDPEKKAGPTAGQSRGGETSDGRTAEDKKPANPHEDLDLDLMENLFQGQLVLRTRCLECENFTERREDFQDISIPVLDEQPGGRDDAAEVSPYPKQKFKTLSWAIGQFASVERIVGEDKYFCETCHHYTEAERSLLFDKTPEVVTIHLKRFSANSSALGPFGGLSKVNTPLQTPLTLSLEEWCTRPSPAEARRYRLFAVVMHSGVTISSGHYTAFVRMSGLRDVKLFLQDEKEAEGEEDTPAKEAPLDYDDGEVSFSLSERRSLASGKKKGKKLSEGGGGLLGGQRSASSYELGGSSFTEGPKRRKTIGQNAECLTKEAGAGDDAPPPTAERQVLNNLLEYEGKWLLFDDSEVRLFEEEDFLRACSPETSSSPSSTPYLLFYRRMAEPEQ